jgi:hypothetical protein
MPIHMATTWRSRVHSASTRYQPLRWKISAVVMSTILLIAEDVEQANFWMFALVLKNCMFTFLTTF